MVAWVQYSTKEILNMNGIVLPKRNSYVVVKTITVEAVEITDNVVKFLVNNKNNEPVYVNGNRRCLKWFYYSKNGKKALNYAQVHKQMPQGKTALNFSVQVHFICEASQK